MTSPAKPRGSGVEGVTLPSSAAPSRSMGHWVSIRRQNKHRVSEWAATRPALCPRSRLRKLPSVPLRRRTSLVEHCNGPMVAAFSGRPSISDRTPRAAPRIEHQLRAGGSAPRRRPSGGSELAAVHCWVPLNPS
jgi:hypothetical protein